MLSAPQGRIIVGSTVCLRQAYTSALLKELSACCRYLIGLLGSLMLVRYTFSCTITVLSEEHQGQ